MYRFDLRKTIADCSDGVVVSGEIKALYGLLDQSSA